MKLTILIIILFILLFCLYLLKYLFSNSYKISYKEKENFLSKVEIDFYKTIKEIIENQFVIQCKVRLEDIIEPIAPKNSKKYLISRNFIRAMHIDFILCEPKSMKVICAIELNDRTHFRENKIISDNKKRAALKDAKIALHEIPVKERENKDFILNKIFSVEN